MIWNSTLQREHYRSNLAVSTSINTPATINTMTLNIQEALRSAGNQFYVAAGGAIAPDAAQALPTFTGDVVIRGGKIGIRVANTFDTADASRSTINGTVFLVRTSLNFTSGSFPATTQVGWDPTLIQDFRTLIGRIVYRKNFLLRDAETADIEYRLKCEKMDVGDYVNTRNTYLWVVLAGNVDVAAARSFAITTYWNLSFSADAV